jgi:hypothetical protein
MSMKTWLAGISLLAMGSGMSANSMGDVTDFARMLAERAMKPKHASWKEEVLLHDGRKLIVERSQSYGGYPTLESRERAVLDEEWAFRVPGSGEALVWKSNHRRPPEGDNLMLLQLNFLEGVPYVATTIAGCLAYNHWKRPNPPYVFFKHDGKAWRQIPLSEFPAAFKDVNVAVGRPNSNHREGLLSIDTIRNENRLLRPYLREIVREPMGPGSDGVNCPELVFYKGAWVGPGDSIGRRMMDRMSK